MMLLSLSSRTSCKLSHRISDGCGTLHGFSRVTNREILRGSLQPRTTAVTLSAAVSTCSLAACASLPVDAGQLAQGSLYILCDDLLHSFAEVLLQSWPDDTTNRRRGLPYDA